MEYFKDGTLIKNNRIIMEDIKRLFLDDKYPQKTLMINHLKYKKLINVDSLRDINIGPSKKVYFYDDRDKTLFLTYYKNVCMFVEQLEPWEEVDCLIFNNTFKWIIGYNHDDEIYYSKPYK